MPADWFAIAADTPQRVVRNISHSWHAIIGYSVRARVRMRVRGCEGGGWDGVSCKEGGEVVSS